MRIEFDTGNQTELEAVSALIAVLRGEQALFPATDPFAERALVTRVHSVPLGTQTDAEPDPAEAFAGGASADQAFGGASPLPPAAPATPPTSAPAGEAATAAAPEGGQTAAPIASPSSAPAGVDVDATGLPHDSRIHSTPASKTADGKWRKKRGVDAATMEAVSVELRRAMAAPAPATVATGAPPTTGFTEALAQSREHLGTGAPAAPPTPPVPPAPADTGSTTTEVAPTAPAAAVADVAAPSAPPAPPVVPTAPAAPAAPPGEMTFSDLMRKITGLQSAGQLTVAGTQEIADSLGLAGVRDLMVRKDLIPSFAALLPGA